MPSWRRDSACSSPFGFIITVLLPMSVLPRRRLTGHCCCENSVERGHCLVDMLALQNERRQKAQHRLAGPVNNDALRHHFSSRALRQLGGIKLDTQHQSHSAHFKDAVVLLLQHFELLLE